MRYGRKDVLRDENGNRMEECEKEKTDEELVAENEHQEVYDPVRREIDFRKLVPTKVKNNSRIVLPEARPRKEEAELMSRANMVENVVKQHKKENGYKCNLTDSEKRGINKLRRE